MSQDTKRFVLITGASSGVGAVYADSLAKRGCDLIPVARRVDRSRMLADKIAGETGRKAEPAPRLSEPEGNGASHRQTVLPVREDMQTAVAAEIATAVLGMELVAPSADQ